MDETGFSGFAGWFGELKGHGFENPLREAFRYNSCVREHVTLVRLQREVARLKRELARSKKGFRAAETGCSVRVVDEVRLTASTATEKGAPPRAYPHLVVTHGRRRRGKHGEQQHRA